MNPRSDLEINRDIRKVLVRHWVDLGRISIRSDHGRVSISGLLAQIAGVGGKISAAWIRELSNEINRIGGIDSLTFDFSNWTLDGNEWRENRTEPGAS